MFYFLPPSKFANMDLGPRGPCLDQALGFGTKTQFERSTTIKENLKRI